ncbi:von Willebrand factor A domain-containing protein 5A-like isoform X3 [Sinocyclocheilus rhinocerous]|nr:PREDICTED: von Willebrand factor A domain-containing protein 5A-like isoform X3 [Sinocyclocheilus rhinocerous]
MVDLASYCARPRKKGARSKAMKAYMACSSAPFKRNCSTMVESAAASHQAEPEPRMDPLLQLISLQKAAGCWELNTALADVFGKTEDEVTNQKPAQVDGSVWATVLALIWLHVYKLDQQVEWQFVAMKAASWIRSQKLDGLSQCVCDGNMLLGSQVTEDALGI